MIKIIFWRRALVQNDKYYQPGESMFPTNMKLASQESISKYKSSHITCIILSIDVLSSQKLLSLNFVKMGAPYDLGRSEYYTIGIKKTYHISRFICTSLSVIKVKLINCVPGRREINNLVKKKVGGRFGRSSVTDDK